MTLAIEGGEPVRSNSLPLATPVLGDEEIKEVTETLESGWITTGERTQEFEARIAEYAGAEHAVAVTNASSALYLAYRSLDVTGEVITSPITFATTVATADLAGATPVLADVRPDTLTLDPESVKEAIGPDTQAIVPVHYAGQAVDLDVFRDLAEDHDLTLIEDAAQGLGGEFEGKAQGTIGDAGCYSFHPTKSITTAEGGVMITNDEEIATTARKLRLAGVNKDAWDRDQDDGPSWYYDVQAVSSKFNMTDVHAAIGLAQFEKLPRFIEQRRTVASLLDEGLASVAGVEPLAVRAADEHARHLYPVTFDIGELGVNRREIDSALNAEGIGTGVYYIPIHHHTAFEDIQRVDLSSTESVEDRTLCLPLHPKLDESDAHDIVRAVEKVVTGL
jgi:dTDP-4-amino-4,6-dideoxygalactose transaminase